MELKRLNKGEGFILRKKSNNKIYGICVQWQRSVHSHLHISSNIHTCIHSSIFTGHLQDDKCHTSSAMQDAKDVVAILYMNIIHEQNLKI